MKAISTNAHITSIRSRRDNSLGFSTETPELTTEEKVAFMNLQGLNLKMLIEPLDGSSEIMTVESNLEGKTPSQRLRAVMFVWWDTQGRPDTFQEFYNTKMESIISSIKGKLD